MDTSSAATQRLRLDAEGRIDEDLRCGECGYNIRGLDPAGRCPECGTPVDRSIQGYLLRFCDPAWLRRLAKGTSWIAVSIVCAVLIVACMWINNLAGLALGTGTFAWATLFTFLHAWPIGLIGLIGYWIVTTPEPDVSVTQPRIFHRSLARQASVLSFVLGGVSHGGFCLNSAWVVFEPISYWVSVLTADVIGMVATYAACVYARYVAMRIPDLRLAKDVWFVLWGIMATSVVTLLYHLVLAAMNTFSLWATWPYVRLVAYVVALVINGACLVFALWSVTLLRRFRAALREAAGLAEVP